MDWHDKLYHPELGEEETIWDYPPIYTPSGNPWPLRTPEEALQEEEEEGELRSGESKYGWQKQ
jgi:hypothetical protein